MNTHYIVYYNFKKWKDPSETVMNVHLCKLNCITVLPFN